MKISGSTEIYRNISSMEPMLPASHTGELSDISTEIHQKVGALKYVLPDKEVRKAIAQIVRGMNSYYSNLIEGHKTLPLDIEKAFTTDFSDNPKAERNQHLSLALIKAEEKMINRLEEDPSLNPSCPAFITWIHKTFYEELPKKEWITTSDSGKEYPLIPGELRDYNVTVGNHTPPDFSSLNAFLSRFHSVYNGERHHGSEKLISLAAAHHRLSWIHPFGDGNGRVTRLQSRAAMMRANIDGEGLWTLSRGLARSKAQYFSKLASADRPRQGTLDGRGNLSDKALAEFCLFILEQTLDQLDFMLSLLSPINLMKRMERYLIYERLDLSSKRREQYFLLLKTLLIEGSMTRGNVSSLLGLKDTASRDTIRAILQDGLVSSPTPKGALHIAFPGKVVESYFPKLYLDLSV